MGVGGASHGNGEGGTSGNSGLGGWSSSGNGGTAGSGPSQCGDGLIEPDEGCDDGNPEFGDGCTPICTREPDCSGGSCASVCGDGLLAIAQNEACDDGNTVNGDGCSSSCQVESGYQCSDSDPDSWGIPVVYRDFRIGGDFEPWSAIGIEAPTQQLVDTTLDPQGKPVFVGTAGQGFITDQASFSQWYRSTPGINTPFASRLRLFSDGAGGYANRWGADGELWTVYANPVLCYDSACSDCGDFTYTAGPDTACLASCALWGVGSTSTCAVDLIRYEGNPLFFPLDNVPGMITPPSEYAAAQVGRAYGMNFQSDPSGALHNFHFTAELHWWFYFDTTQSYAFDFAGDDDVWVFINRRLAVDIGGAHNTVHGTLQLSADGGGTVTISQTATSLPSTPTVQNVALGLVNGGLYEIAVFYAERKTALGTFLLKLNGPKLAPSRCSRQ
jgi:fibro-slime domain-containing protein